MPTVDSLIPLQVIPERRGRESPDTIDIDALDADDVVYVGSAPPSQRRRVGEDGRAAPVPREVIDLSDSEEDNDIEFIAHNPPRPEPPLMRRRRLFSPPPPPQLGGIPPVPQIPQQFLPLHPRPPPGLIIPNENPLPFEANLRPPRPTENPPPRPAPASHHVPSMGFGGALLAGVQRIIRPRHVQQAERRNGWGVSGSFIMRWDPFDFVEDDSTDELDNVPDEDNPFAAGRVRNQLERALKQRERTEPDYKSEYTHPKRPLPGFTHDFSLSSTASTPISEDNEASLSCLASSSGARLCEVTLVCAGCQDPFVVGATDVGEDRAKRKIWSLRCGHLIDGKCLEQLMEPPSPTTDPIGSSSRRMTTELESDLPFPSQDTVIDSNANSVRSRLRPRRGMTGPLPHAALASSSSGRRATPAATQRSNRKGKGKMKAPSVEAEYEWSCPVSECDHVSLSLLTDGGWKMDEKRGAIAVFV